MLVGLDTFALHRLLGAPRPGETPASRALADGGVSAIAIARAEGCDVVSLQTCFLDPPSELDEAALLSAAGDMRIVLAWGHPEGLGMGRDPHALDDLAAWLPVAARLGGDLIRIVVGGPRLRGLEPVDEQLRATAGPLASAARRAHDHGLRLAVENHADLTAAELARLLDALDEPVGVCFDTANAARVGDDVVAAAGLLADRVLMVHLKDVTDPRTAFDALAGPVSVPFGEGVVPLDAVLAQLGDPIARGAAVCVELGQIAPGDDELDLIARSLRWLRDRKER